jgi:hypothetical protein
MAALESNVWATNALGGYMFSEELSHKLRASLEHVWKVDCHG